MVINHNLSAMFSERIFGNNKWAMDKVSERLSSGMRINRGADDAAGLAVSEGMRTQIRGLNMAARNALDGVSLIQTTEGYLEEITSILQRLGELSVQAANGVYTDSDRSQIQVEVNQLVDELDRIAAQAQFNTHRVLSSKFEGDGVLRGGASPEDRVGVAPVEPAENTLVIHLGANMDERTWIKIGNIHTANLFVDGTPDLSEQDLANGSIEKIQTALSKVNALRADLGAYQNRLEYAIKGIEYTSENMQASESRIRDTNMATEIVDYVKYTILAQSSSSMLAQANMTPQIVLKLLR